MATVSVIIPTFNRAGSLVRAVQSALGQTIGVHEVLVCDDGSTDDSAGRVTAIADPRVKWIAGPHAGRPAPPRNRGIGAATGEWLAFLDDDDVWEPGKLDAQFRAMHQQGTDASCTNALRITPDEKRGTTYFDDVPAAIGLEDLLRVNLVICSSALVRRDHVANAGGFPEAPQFKALEDYALWLRLCAFTRFAYCREPLVTYTDAPAGSVRGPAVPIDQQRDVVLSDLWTWSGSGHYGRAQRRLIARYLRGARRGAGRSITDWIFIR